MSLPEKPRKKRSQGASNKDLGSTIERLYANIFRTLGFKFCATSRLKSKALDNAKIDLADIPYNVQIKAGVQKAMNPGKELMSMAGAMKEIFPPEDQVHFKPCFLIHHKLAKPFQERTEELSLVYMTLVEFQKFKAKYPAIEYDAVKIFKSALPNTPFKYIIRMKFEYFKNNVIRHDI